MSSAEKTTEQIERDINETRSRIDRDLDQLQSKLSPGELIDEAVTYVRGTGGDLAEGIGRTIRDNPVPAALIGAGLGLLLLSRVSASRKQQTSGAATDGHPETYAGLDRSAVDGAGQALKSHDAAQAKETLSEKLDEVGEQVSELAEEGRHKLESARDRAAKTVTETAERARHSARKVASATGRFVDDHPLAVGFLGLAAGAGVAALVRSSQRENKLMGARSDRLKQAARETAVEQSEKLREAAVSAGERALEEAKSRGFTKENVKSRIETVIDEGREIAKVAGAAAQEELAEPHTADAGKPETQSNRPEARKAVSKARSASDEQNAKARKVSGGNS
jgi:ElaB/YqjD/DUF883 family membrane-anchored ribosome-binding protein